LTLNLAMLTVSAILGACIGSFLNVVIYRMPRGLSIGNPRRSFCPHCGHTIAGYDNIPVISYLLLRGRCRHCRAAISVQYPLVELVTALLFAATYDVFIVHQWRAGVNTWPQDGAIIVAHWVLWAGLLATAAMDIEAYHLDVRVTWTVTAIGILCNTLWTPESSAGWIRPGPATAAGAIAAALALAVTALYTLGRARPVEAADDEALSDETASQTPDALASAARTRSWPATTAVALGLAAVAGYVWWANATSGLRPGEAESWTAARIGLLLTVLMALTIAASGAPRRADEEIVEAIEAESVSARAVALREAVWLAPTAITGILVAVVWSRAFAGDPGASGALLDWAPAGQWRPVLGLATGLSGWLIAGALGWAVRLVFTLILGKEALGVGDIHILAAAGAVAGWLVVVIGFFLSAPLALIGVLFFLLRRRSRAIQYGPWLALGFFLAAVAQDRIIDALKVGWMLR